MMKKQISCGLIPVYLQDGKKYVLLIQGRHNNWGFPKGHIEPGEDCIATALREFEEETGIPSKFVEIDKGKFWEDKYWFVLNGEKIFKTVKYYLAYLKPGFEHYIHPQEGEINQIKLVLIEDADKFLEFESLKNIMGDLKLYLSN